MNLSMTRRQMIAGASLGGLGAMSSLRDARAATTWSAYTYVPVGSVASVRGLQMMIDQFSQATNGEVKAQLHLGGSLPIAGTDITQAVENHTLSIIGPETDAVIVGGTEEVRGVACSGISGKRPGSAAGKC